MNSSTNTMSLLINHHTSKSSLLLNTIKCLPETRKQLTSAIQRYTAQNKVATSRTANTNPRWHSIQIIPASSGMIIQLNVTRKPNMSWLTHHLSKLIVTMNLKFQHLPEVAFCLQIKRKEIKTLPPNRWLIQMYTSTKLVRNLKLLIKTTRESTVVTFQNRTDHNNRNRFRN
jgi:hypothetical protein